MSKVQLVLQFKPWDDRPFDQLIEFEDQLMAVLEGIGEVDGHDLGSGEANIFILTDKLSPVLTRTAGVLAVSGLRSICSAGYRSLEQRSYVRVWPLGDASPFRVA